MYVSASCFPDFLLAEVVVCMMLYVVCLILLGLLALWFCLIWILIWWMFLCCGMPFGVYSFCVYCIGDLVFELDGLVLCLITCVVFAFDFRVLVFIYMRMLVYCCVCNLCFEFKAVFVRI